jgi:predicted small integral membrane protein
MMWQSRVWNGLDASGRNFAIQALVMLIVLSPEPAEPADRALEES